MRGPWASGTRARRARSRHSARGGGGQGAGARAVDSSARPGLAGILFWSRGRVGRARCVAGGRRWRSGARRSCARTRGRREGVRWSSGGLQRGFPPLDLFSVPSPGEGELNGERR